MLNNLTPPAIIIKNACLRYAGQLLFNNLNCQLPAGKTTCLLGSSGVGKSSLLRLIAGLYNTDSQQQATIETSDAQPLQHRVAYMAQNDLLLPWLTVLDNVLLGYRLRKHPLLEKDIAYAHQLLYKVGLAQATTKLPSQLSGGMRQRVALARTLMENRTVILMDEPFSALDTVTRLRLQNLAAELFANRTVLIITHDPLEALRLGHQILIMSGQPAQLDTVFELPGTPPREPTAAHVLHAQAGLMQRLLQQRESTQ